MPFKRLIHKFSVCCVEENGLIKRFAFVLVFVILVLAGAVSSLFYLNTHATFSSKLESFTIGLLPHEIEGLVYAAEDQQYFAANGLNVTIKNYIPGLADTGAGIPEDVKPKLFQPLFTTKSKGRGFGLVAVKRLTEALNGSVVFEDQTGKGTKFIIKLPQKP